MASGGSVDDTPDQHGITEELVGLFLRRFLAADAQPVIKSYKYRPLATLGEGYTTVRKVLEVSYRDAGTAEDGEAAFVVKVPSGAMAEEMRRLGLYEREVVMYSQVVEHFRQLLRRRDNAAKELPFPRFIYGTIVKDGEVLDDHEEPTADQTQQQEMVVLELLDDYEVVDKVVGFDLEHLRLVLPAMARFHATGYVLHQRHPDKVKRLRDIKVIFPKETADQVGSFMEPIAAVLEYNGRSAEAEVLRGLCTWDVFMAGWEATFTEDREVVALVHGDLWSSNMMFRYQTDSDGVRRPVDIKFVDLQMCQFGDLAFDLMYCLFASTRGPLRRQHMKQLLGWYEVAFRQQLELLGEDADKMAPWLSVEKLHTMYGTVMHNLFANAMMLNLYLFSTKAEKNEMGVGQTQTNLSEMAEACARIAERWARGECGADLTARLLEITDDLKEFGIV